MRKFWYKVFISDYSKYDIKFRNFYDFLSFQLREIAFPIFQIILCIIILLPFQFIKDWYFKRYKVGMNWIFKYIILFVLITIIHPAYVQITDPNFLIKFLLFYIPYTSILFVLLYWFIDKKFEVYNEHPNYEKDK
ncbi:hypothetical protein [Sphingobacterium sp. HJSM2_6]|uniref:hypothetical protein n=1 Tax=Sphingobacterium sp. HJSM2_6 TaxID=3366264 RepID=UPI003BF4704C